MTHYNFYLLLPLQQTTGLEGLSWGLHTLLSAGLRHEAVANPGSPCGQERSAGREEQQILMLDECPMEDDKTSLARKQKKT